MHQQTPEWFAARCGNITASRIADVMAKGRGGEPSASRANYRAELIAERLTGTVAESFSNAAIQHGIDNEPIARAAYEIHTGFFVDQVSFIPHPSIPMAGASPDGMIDDDGLTEIKCPNTATHLDYLLTRSIPLKYQYQMLWQMECTGRKWCDFVSFDPRLPDGLNLIIIRFYRDDERIEEIRNGVTKLNQEIDEMIVKLEAIRKGN